MARALAKGSCNCCSRSLLVCDSTVVVVVVGKRHTSSLFEPETERAGKLVLARVERARKRLLLPRFSSQVTNQRSRVKVRNPDTYGKSFASPWHRSEEATEQEQDER